MARNLLDSGNDYDEPDLSFQGSDISALLKVAAGLLPSDLDAQRVLQIATRYGGSAYFLSESDIAEVCRPKTLAKSKQHLITGKVSHKTFDGDEIGAAVLDLNRVYHPSFTFDLSEEGCDCNEPAATMCSHLTALMLAWAQDKRSFLTVNPLPDEQNAFMQSDFGEFMTFVTGERDCTRGLAKLLNNPLHAGTPAHEPRSGADSALSSTGMANWPTARTGRTAQQRQPRGRR